MSDPSAQTAWETLHTGINNQKISVDERTMSSRDMVKELTHMNLNAQNAPIITGGTGLHCQKMSNLCVYYATVSAVRHEMKKIFENLTSKAVNIYYGNSSSERLIPIPAGKSIEELFEEKKITFGYTTLSDTDIYQSALTFERMLSVLLGCVSPRALSGLIKINIHLKL